MSDDTGAVTAEAVEAAVEKQYTDAFTEFSEAREKGEPVPVQADTDASGTATGSDGGNAGSNAGDEVTHVARERLRQLHAAHHPRG